MERYINSPDESSSEDDDSITTYNDDFDDDTKSVPETEVEEEGEPEIDIESPEKSSLESGASIATYSGDFDDDTKSLPETEVEEEREPEINIDSPEESSSENGDSVTTNATTIEDFDTDTKPIPETEVEEEKVLKPFYQQFNEDISLIKSEIEEEEVIPTGIFSKSPITNAMSAFRGYSTILANKVQQITSWARQKSDTEAEEARVAELSSPNDEEEEFERSFKLAQHVTSLVLQAKNDDEMTLVNGNDRIYFVKSEDAQSPNTGPAMIEFTSPLKEFIVDSSWILNEVPASVEQNPGYIYEKSKEPFRNIIAKMATLPWELIQYRSGSTAYITMRDYVRQFGTAIQDHVNAAIGFIVKDAIWETVYDENVREEQESGEDGEEMIDTETIEYERGIKKEQWLSEQESMGEFVKKEYQCRIGGGLQWKGMESLLLKEEV